MRPRSLFNATAAADNLLTAEQAKALANKIIGMAKADETRVVIDSGWTGNTRFAGGEITTSGESNDVSVSVVSTIGKRRASASTNVLEDASLQ